MKNNILFILSTFMIIIISYSQTKMIGNLKYKDILILDTLYFFEDCYQYRAIKVDSSTREDLFMKNTDVINSTLSSGGSGIKHNFLEQYLEKLIDNYDKYILLSVRISSMIHDNIESNSIYDIAFNSKEGKIFYISTKDSFKQDTLSIKDIQIIYSFFEYYNNSINKYNNQFPIETDILIKTYDSFKESESCALLLNYSLSEDCNDENRFIAHRFYKLLLKKTDEMRCK